MCSLTFYFVRSTQTVDPSALDDTALEASARACVDDVIARLSLSSCANTVLGDELNKGASGCVTVLSCAAAYDLLLHSDWA
jgi:hypothetical protein